MSTAFVLSGGGSLGAVQVGMLQALAQRHVQPDLLVGTSAGAVNAAFIAGRGTSMDALHDLAEIWAGLRRRDIFPLRPLHQLVAGAGTRNALCSDRGLSHVIAAHLTYARLEQAPIPVHLVTTNLLSGAEVLLSHGDAASAVLASAAIPGVFPPVCRDGLILVDGALADNAAISQAVALGADRVFVLPTGYACALSTPPKHALGVAMQALGLLIQQRLITDATVYAARVELTVLPPLCPLTVSPIDFSRARQLIERARTTSGSWLDGHTRPPSHPELVLSTHNHPPASDAMPAADPPSELH